MSCLLQGKAIRHYLLDVCVNPVRIDSWAGMALARGSQLETKLNSVSVIFTVGSDCQSTLYIAYQNHILVIRIMLQ